LNKKSELYEKDLGVLCEKIEKLEITNNDLNNENERLKMDKLK
jgi:hypothetical protein